MGLSVVPDKEGKGGYVVFTNRGEGADAKSHGTHIYRVDDLKKINPTFINNMVNGHANGTSHEEIMRQFHEVTDHQQPVHSIKQKSQKNDNCTIANVRANMHGILLCQEAQKQGKPVKNLSKNDRDNVKKEYKKFTSHMHGEKIHQLSDAIRQDPNNQDLRNLAVQYIIQHPGDNKKKYKDVLQTSLNETAAISNNKTVTQAFDHTKTKPQAREVKPVMQNPLRTSSKTPRRPH
jgi:hypothetical protein